jgi:penicillin-binding protein 1A
MTHRQRQSRRRRRQGARSKVLLGLGVFATIIVIAVCSAAGYVLAIAASAPDLSELKADDKGQISVVYAADGSRLGFVQSDILRRVIPFSDIPVDMRRATVAIEDERFYKHGGVDINAIVRAGIAPVATIVPWPGIRRGTLATVPIPPGLVSVMFAPW